MIVNPAFIVLAYFMAGPEHQDLNVQQKACPDMACVEQMIEHAKDSRFLSRLRVLEGDSAAQGAMHQPFWRPVIDLTFG